MQWLAGLSVRRSVLASVIILAMVFLGAFSYSHLNIERWPNVDIPIIVVTSYALSGDEAKARAAGADAYVAKPFSPRALLATIRRFLPSPAS